MNRMRPDVYARPIKMDKEQLRHFVSDGVRLVTLPEVHIYIYMYIYIYI